MNPEHRQSLEDIVSYTHNRLLDAVIGLHPASVQIVAKSLANTDTGCVILIKLPQLCRMREGRAVFIPEQKWYLSITDLGVYSSTIGRASIQTHAKEVAAAVAQYINNAEPVVLS